MDDSWLSMKEICEYLGVSHDTISRWIAKEMPALKMGGIWRFKKHRSISGLRKVVPKKY
jgi:excisionase family DNA binding protein